MILSVTWHACDFILFTGQHLLTNYWDCSLQVHYTKKVTVKAVCQPTVTGIPSESSDCERVHLGEVVLDRVWMSYVMCVCSARNGVSSYKLFFCFLKFKVCVKMNLLANSVPPSLNFVHRTWLRNIQANIFTARVRTTLCVHMWYWKLSWWWIINDNNLALPNTGILGWFTLM